ncbi:MAG: hypothetical protein WC779_08405 [Candidatus Omnitrophota bacterium]
MKRISIIAVTAFIISIAVFVPYSEAVNLNIDPPRVELSIKPGEEKHGYIVISNLDTTGDAAHVRVYVQDLVYLPDGSNDFLPENSTPWSLSEWIKVGPTEFDIPPGKQEMVRFVMNVPQGATGGHYGVVFFETGVSPSKSKEVGASVNIRLGTIVLVGVEGTQTFKAKLKGISVTGPDDDGAFETSYTVFNEGNTLVRPKGTLKIIDAKKNQVDEIDVNKEKSGVLPQTSRRFSQKYTKTLPAGTYFAQVMLDYGGDVLLGGQTSFTVK